MPDEKKTDDVDKVLADMKAVDDRKQALIEGLLKQRAAAIKEIDDRKAAVEKEFDEKLAKLGYRVNSGKPERSHHKNAA